MILSATRDAKIIFAPANAFDNARFITQNFMRPAKGTGLWLTSKGVTFSVTFCLDTKSTKKVKASYNLSKLLCSLS